MGREISRILAGAGADLVVHYHSSKKEAEEAASEIRSLGKQCHLVQGDLSRPESVEGMLDELNTRCPAIDILVNSASVFYKTPLAEVTPQQWDENLNVNLRAPFQLARALGLAMKRRGGGRIINITDSAVERLYTGYLPYLVSKAGLEALTQILALELAPEVLVNAVAPGTVLLPPEASVAMEAGIIRRTPLGRIGTPHDVAQLVLFLVRDGSFMTGGIHRVDGGSALGK